MQNDNKGDKCYQFLKFYTLSILPIKLHSKSMEKKQRVPIQIVRKQKYFIAIFVYKMILFVVQNRLSSGGMENTTNYFQIINKKQRNYSISFSLLVPLNGKFCIHKIKRIYVFWFILWSLTLVYKPIPFT